jgi:hypothetical protein
MRILILRLKRLRFAMLTWIMLGCSVASGQLPEQRLQEASIALYMDGNIHFILAEALKDGFIKEGISYDFDYRDSTVTINGKVLPQPAQNRYRKLLIAFHRPVLVNKTSFSLRGDGLKLSEVLDTSSSFYHPSILEGMRTTHRTFANEQILRKLVRDGIADTTEVIHLVYSKAGLTVNGRTLSPKLEQSCMWFIMNEAGFIPRKETDTFRIDGKAVMR